MFSPHSSDELKHDSIISINFILLLLFHLLLIFFNAEKNSWRNTGYTVEQRFSKIDFPFPIPRMDYFLIILFLSINGLISIELDLIPNFFLIHCQNVQGLIKLYTFTSSYFTCLVFIYHDSHTDYNKTKYYFFAFSLWSNIMSFTFSELFLK